MMSLYAFINDLSVSQRAQAFRVAADRLEKQQVHVQHKCSDGQGHGCSGNILGNVVAEIAGKSQYFGGYTAASELIQAMARDKQPLPIWGNLGTATFNDSHTKEECVDAMRACADELDTPKAAPMTEAVQKRSEKPGTKRYYASLWRKAAEVIREKGWTQGSYENAQGAQCCVGAFGGTPAYGHNGDCTVYNVMNAITGAKPDCVVTFNDKHCKTKEDILRFMSAVAYSFEHGGGMPSWVQRLVEARKTPVLTPIAKALQDASDSLTEANWHKGSYFAEKNGLVCMCAHGAVQAKVNKRVIDARADNTSAVASAAAAEVAAPTAAPAAFTAEVGKDGKQFSDRPAWVKSGLKTGLDAHYIMGMVGLTAPYNDGPATLSDVKAKFFEAVKLATELGQ